MFDGVLINLDTSDELSRTNANMAWNSKMCRAQRKIPERIAVIGRVVWRRRKVATLALYAMLTLLAASAEFRMRNSFFHLRMHFVCVFVVCALVNIFMILDSSFCVGIHLSLYVCVCAVSGANGNPSKRHYVRKRHGQRIVVDIALV